MTLRLEMQELIQNGWTEGGHTRAENSTTVTAVVFVTSRPADKNFGATLAASHVVLVLPANLSNTIWRYEWDHRYQLLSAK